MQDFEFFFGSGAKKSYGFDDLHDAKVKLGGLCHFQLGLLPLYQHFE